MFRVLLCTIYTLHQLFLPLSLHANESGEDLCFICLAAQVRDTKTQRTIHADDSMDPRNSVLMVRHSLRFLVYCLPQSLSAWSLANRDCFLRVASAAGALWRLIAADNERNGQNIKMLLSSPENQAILTQMLASGSTRGRENSLKALELLNRNAAKEQSVENSIKTSGMIHQQTRCRAKKNNVQECFLCIYYTCIVTTSLFPNHIPSYSQDPARTPSSIYNDATRNVFYTLHWMPKLVGTLLRLHSNTSCTYGKLGQHHMNDGECV